MRTSRLFLAVQAPLLISLVAGALAFAPPAARASKQDSDTAGAPSDVVTYDVASGTESRMPLAELTAGRRDFADAGFVPGFRGRRAAPSRSKSGNPRRDVVIGTNDLMPVPDATAYPFSAVCKVITRWPNGTFANGTGTLIGPRHVVTAAHIVYSHDRGGFARTIEVTPGLDGPGTGTHGWNTPFGIANSVLMHTFLGWTDRKKPTWDMALLTLDQDIGEETGWLGYGWWESHVGVPSLISGYRGSSNPAVALTQIFATGEIIAEQPRASDPDGPRMLYYEIDTVGGHSGSGIIFQDDDGELYVQGVHKGGHAPTQWNWGPEIDLAKFGAFQRLIDGE
jgi:V8-like Glu-specific endopeptidase